MSMREKLIRFMQGRYGTDQFSRFLLGVALVMVVLSLFIRSGIWSILVFALIIYCYFPVFRRSTRKVPAFSSSHFFTFSPEPRLFLYLRHIFNALWGLFLLKIFLEYSIIMVLYGTLLGGELWRTFYDRKKRKKDSICKCMTPTGTRR